MRKVLTGIESDARPRQANKAKWSELTKEEQRDAWNTVFEEMFDEMCEQGIFRVVGMKENGHKIYALTEAGRSPHLILNPPKTKQ